MSDLTTHQLAARWEQQVASDLGGRRQPGSGNRVQAKLDVRAGLLIVECKYTSAESFRVTAELLDGVRSAALGPAGPDPSVTPLLAVELGESRRRVAVVEWDVLVDWMRSPPEIVPATSRDRLRAAARTPTLLR